MVILDERDQREMNKRDADDQEDVTPEVKRVSVGRHVRMLLHRYHFELILDSSAHYRQLSRRRSEDVCQVVHRAADHIASYSHWFGTQGAPKMTTLILSHPL